MCALDYRVEFRDVAELQNDLALYKAKVERAIESIDEASDRFRSLQSFQGEAAESIKSYLQEVHGALSSTIRNLLGALAADYAQNYYALFGMKPVEDAEFSAKWSSRTMSDAEVKMWEPMVGDGALPKMQRKVSSAVDMASEAGCPCSAPSVDAFRFALCDEAMQTQRVRDGVASIEARGYQTFSSDKSEFFSLLVAARLGLMLFGGANGKGSALTYAKGSFSRFAKSSGLDGAIRRVEDRIRAAQYDVREAQEDSFTQSLEWNADEIDAALKSKKNALYLKLIGLLIGAGCILVEIGSGGAATPIVASVLSFGLAVGSAGDAASQIGDINKGGLGVEIVTDNKGREVLKIGEQVHGYTEEMPELINLLKSGDSAALEAFFADKGGDLLKGEVPKQFGVKGKASYDALKSYIAVGQETVKSGSTLTGLVGSASKSMTVTADLALKIIDDGIVSRIERIDDLERTLGGAFGRERSSVRYTTLTENGSACAFDPQTSEGSEGANTQPIRQPDSGSFVPLP